MSVASIQTVEGKALSSHEPYTSLRTVGSNFFFEIFDHLYEGVCFIDRDQRIAYWSKGAERIVGYKESEVVGTRCSDNLCIHLDEEGLQRFKGRCPSEKAPVDGTMREGRLYLRHREGHTVQVSSRAIPIHSSDGLIEGVVLVFSDYLPKAEIMKRIEELQKLAMLDPLTEVGNRRCAETYLHTRFDEMRRYGRRFGVILFDIDHFKLINDIYGHDAGDSVLKRVAGTLSDGLRSFDVISRWGGDEFLAIVVKINQDQLSSIAHKLKTRIEQSTFPVGSRVIRVRISIGAILVHMSDTMETALKRADLYMYRNKFYHRRSLT